MAESVKFAESGSRGALAGLIGWIDFGADFNLAPGGRQTVVNTIPNGYTISFDASLIQTYTGTGAVPISFGGFTTPVLDSSAVAFGNTGYTGINGNVALYMDTESALNVDTISQINVSNIRVTDSNGQNVTNFSIVVADVESTNKVETWGATTDGTAWVLLDVLPAPNGFIGGGPVISGTGTDTISETGVDVNIGFVTGPVYITQRPQNLILRCLANDSRQGFALGIIVQSSCYCAACVVQSSNIGNICPGSLQYYKFVVSSSCGNYTIVYTGSNYNSETGVVSGTLANYKITSYGIIVEPKPNIQNGTIEVLPFQIISQCGITDFEIVFTYSQSICNQQTSSCC